MRFRFAFHEGPRTIIGAHGFGLQHVMGSATEAWHGHDDDYAR